MNPNYAEAHNNMGVLYRDEGLVAEAIISYEKCLQSDPNSRNAAHNRCGVKWFLFSCHTHRNTHNTHTHTRTLRVTHNHFHQPYYI